MLEQMIKNDKQYPFWLYIAISVIFHIVVFSLFYLGLPKLRKEPEEQIMTFEVLPVTSVSNIKTQKVQRDKAITSEKSKKLDKASKTNPTKKPEPKKDIPKKDQVILKEKPKPKPKQKKPDPKPKTPQKKDADKSKVKAKPKKKVNEMEKLLKTLEKESEGKEAKSRKRSIGYKSNAIEDAIGKFKESIKLSISEVQYIKQRMKDHWNVPIGVKNASEISVVLHISFEPNGEVKQVSMIDKTCPSGSEIICNAAIDSAIRAVWQASPFDQLAPTRYESWKEFHMEFTPEEF